MKKMFALTTAIVFVLTLVFSIYWLSHGSVSEDDIVGGTVVLPSEGDAVDDTVTLSEEDAIALAYAALEDVTADPTHEIETEQKVIEDSIQWYITISNVTYADGTSALGAEYRQSFWITLDAVTGEIETVDYSR